GEWPERARVELEAAARELAGYFDAPVPITVLAEWKAISGDTVGTGGPGQLHRNFPNAPRQDVLYPPALANQLAGRRLNTTGGADVQTAYNSNTNFYFGRDAKGPTGTEDFYTTVMHEVIHGMGFLGTMVVADGVGRWGDEDGMVNPSNHGHAHHHGARGATSAIPPGLKELNRHLLEDHFVPLSSYRVPTQGGTVYPDIFDQFVVSGAGVRLIDTSVFANNSPALAAQIQSNNLFWSGPAASAANGGQRPKLYAPNPFESGSSVGHLDEATFDKPSNPNAMLAPRGSNVTSVKVGSVILGIMADLGWRTRQP
ncbi:MAG: hypothetical protein HY329_01345, partial [Chloroflexi bacterium]|nr:hypothetical protein [Chloroflexota bacterium]